MKTTLKIQVSGAPKMRSIPRSSPVISRKYTNNNKQYDITNSELKCKTIILVLATH